LMRLWSPDIAARAAADGFHGRHGRIHRVGNVPSDVHADRRD